MTELDPIPQLIRLKRHEQPPADFVEDFIGTFHQRQRAELLQQSARGLLWERITTYFDDLMTPKVGWAFATVLAVGALLFAFKPAGHQGHDLVINTSVAVKEAATQTIAHATTDERYLISGHYKGGLGDDLNARPKVDPLFQEDRGSRGIGTMLPAGLRISDDVKSP